MTKQNVRYIEVRGAVTKGFRIASGLNSDGIEGPRGIILKDSFVKQRPFFEKEIPEILEVWTGTVNVDIAPHIHHMRDFDYEVTCEWQPGITETFGFVTNVTLCHNGISYSALIYYPFPSEIHEPRLNIIEILAPKVNGLAYGDNVRLGLPEDKISVE